MVRALVQFEYERLLLHQTPALGPQRPLALELVWWGYWCLRRVPCGDYLEILQMGKIDSQHRCGNRRFGCSHGSEFLTRERAELDKLLVVGGKSKEITNTLVRTTYIRGIKKEREWHASESLRRVLSGNCNPYTDLVCFLGGVFFSRRLKYWWLREQSFCLYTEGTSGHPLGLVTALVTGAYIYYH